MSAPFKYRTLSDKGQHYVFVVHNDTPDWWRIVGVFRSKERAEGYAEFENMFLDDDDLPAARADELPAPEDLPASPPSKIVAENFQPAPSAQVAAAPAPVAVAPVATKDPKADGAPPPKTLEAEDGEVDGVWLSAQQRTIYDAIVSAAESGAVTPLNSELARLIGHDYDSAACSVANVLEKKGLIVREGFLGDRIFIVVKTGKRTTARGKWSRVPLEKQTAGTNAPSKDGTNANDVAKNEATPHDTVPIAEKPTLAVDLDRNQVLISGREPLRVTPFQAEMLHVLAEKINQVVTSDRMIMRVYGVNEPDDAESTLKVQLCKLRKKLEDTPFQITTHWGSGTELHLRGAKPSIMDDPDEPESDPAAEQRAPHPWKANVPPFKKGPLPPATKIESVEEFLARGGKVNRVEPPRKEDSTAPVTPRGYGTSPAL